MSEEYGYGLWLLVVVNSLIFIVFAASFFRPRSRRDWRVLGGFSAFVVALFTEMYGYPLTVYLLTGPLGGIVPGVDLSHDAGHLWADLIGWKGDPHVSPFHLASYAFLIGGFWLLAAAWKVLLAAVKAGELATTGPYARVRHPQYLGLVLIMVGFLLQWPTLATLVMFPILLLVYRRLAIREEREVAERFGEAWERYARKTPRFVPRFQRPAAPALPGESRAEAEWFTLCGRCADTLAGRDVPAVLPLWGILSSVNTRVGGVTMSDTITYSVPGVHCAHCGMSIREEVSEVEGVEEVEVDVEGKVVTVRGSELSDERLRAAIREAGYEAA